MSTFKMSLLVCFIVGIQTSVASAAPTSEESRWYTQRQNLDAMQKQEGTAYHYPPKKNKSIQTAVKSEYTAVVEDQSSSDTNFYVSLLGGALSYPFQNSMPELSGAGGIALGLPVGLDFWVEGGFLYSFQDAATLQASTLQNENVDHFGVSGSLKSFFGFSNNWIMPSAGLILAYTRRLFNGDERTSDAFDGGLSGGVEVAVNRSINLGFEGRYMRNFSYETGRAVSPGEASQLASNKQSSQDIETLDYWVFLVNAKMKF